MSIGHAKVLTFEHSVCAFCGTVSYEGKFMFCSKCRIVVYCSKEHQVNHWKKHKRLCKDNVWCKDDPLGIAAAKACSVSACACKGWYAELERTTLLQRDAIENIVKTENGSSPHRVAVNSPESKIPQTEPLTPANNKQLDSVNDGFTYSPLSQSDNIQDNLENHAPAYLSLAGSCPSSSSKTLPSQNVVSSSPISISQSTSSSSSTSDPSTVVKETILTYPNTSKKIPDSEVKHDHVNLRSEVKAESPPTSNNISITSSSTTIPFQHRNNMQYFGQTAQPTRSWLTNVWTQVIEDLDHYGVCVIDNLLGELRGAAVLREVQMMYSKGAFQDGQLVQGNLTQSRSIRGDKITWVDGAESHCKNIAFLIRLLDSIVIGANKVANNGKLGHYLIKGRSKAMIACYPGSGTHYVKHVDNPNDDGRCVTAIYYLNKDWNTSEYGGLLRIFPEGWDHQVADIEPLFDRVIFFWSDRRNPHEVQPAFKTRYAITLWYFDSNCRTRSNNSNQVNLGKNLSSMTSPAVA